MNRPLSSLRPVAARCRPEISTSAHTVRTCETVDRLARPLLLLAIDRRIRAAPTTETVAWSTSLQNNVLAQGDLRAILAVHRGTVVVVAEAELVRRLRDAVLRDDVAVVRAHEPTVEHAGQRTRC